LVRTIAGPGSAVKAFFLASSELWPMKVATRNGFSSRKVCCFEKETVGEVPEKEEGERRAVEKAFEFVFGGDEVCRQDTADGGVEGVDPFAAAGVSNPEDALFLEHPVKLLQGAGSVLKVREGVQADDGIEFSVREGKVCGARAGDLSVWREISGKALFDHSGRDVEREDLSFGAHKLREEDCEAALAAARFDDSGAGADVHLLKQLPGDGGLLG
jgi:hypothetical protein